MSGQHPGVNSGRETYSASDFSTSPTNPDPSASPKVINSCGHSTAPRSPRSGLIPSASASLSFRAALWQSSEHLSTTLSLDVGDAVDALQMACCSRRPHEHRWTTSDGQGAAMSHEAGEWQMSWQGWPL